MHISLIDFLIISFLILYSIYFPSFLNRCNNKLGYHISKKILLLEQLINIMVSILIYFLYGINLYSIMSLFALTLCINLSFVDIKYMEISDEINCILLLIGLFNLFINFETAYLYFLGFIIGGGIYLLISASTNGAIGGGDIKLMACIGLIFGVRAALFIMLTSSLLSFFSLMYFLLFKKNSFQKFIPFGPFICLGIIIFLINPNLYF